MNPATQKALSRTVRRLMLNVFGGAVTTLVAVPSLLQLLLQNRGHGMPALVPVPVRTQPLRRSR